MIYIVVPVFNRKKFTEDCLISLSKQTFQAYKTIVVDHGSTDGTSEMVAQQFPGVILIKGSDSLWWSGATNLGIVKALALTESDDDFVLTLNNDLIVEPDYLQELVSVYQQNKPCLVGSVSVYYNDHEKVEFAGLQWNNITAKFKASPLVKETYSSLQHNHNFLTSDLLSGRGTLIPIKAFKDLGLFDEQQFPHYAGDEDFTLRCKKNGYKLLLAVKAVVKSHVKDTGLNFNHQKITFAQFKQTLSSIRSANNLTIRYRWAKKNTPLPYLYFSIDAIRIWGSYFRSVISNNH